MTLTVIAWAPVLADSLDALEQGKACFRPFKVLIGSSLMLDPTLQKQLGAALGEGCPYVVTNKPPVSQQQHFLVEAIRHFPSQCALGSRAVRIQSCTDDRMASALGQQRHAQLGKAVSPRPDLERPNASSLACVS
ncbi:MAG: hypothetical protein IPN71_00060 [Fibrobacteres bacterium]|nr:hypothetical protein [Fibrobacterota bacterium]